MSNRAEEVITQAVAIPGEAIDPASITLIITAITSLIGLCRNKGASQAESVAAIRSGKGKQKLRNALKKELGKDEYKKRGGNDYADKVIAAGMAAKVTEVRSFVAETYSACSE